MTLLGAEEKSVLNVLPVGMQNSALVLKDEDGSSINADLEELSNASEPNLVPAAINVENSNDVIIGPVTQFHGPVTIYQNVAGSGAAPIENGFVQDHRNGKLVKSESNASESAYQPDTPTKNFLDTKHRKFFVISAILLIVLAVAATITIISIKSYPDAPPSKPNRPPSPNSPDDHDHNKVVPADPGHIIEKSVWGGRDPVTTVPLPHPTKLVIISHTATPQCKNFPDCSDRIKNIQSFHFGRGNPDIGYNFLIGSDGNAYVGRGWDVRNFHGVDSIGICFIGDYTLDYLTSDMIDVAKKLLKKGVELGKLDKDYKLIGHNQTFATQSPGPHVYEIIKTWPHFDPSSYIEAEDL